MKKIKISIKLVLVAILFLLLLSMQLPIFAATGKSTATNVRVRKSPSLNSEVIELLDEDDSVKILGQEGDWYKVNFKGTVGYVSKTYIQSKDNIDNIESNENNQNNNVNNNENKSNEENSNNSNNTEQVNTENNQENNKQESNTENVPENQDMPVVNKAYKLSETTKVYILPVISTEAISELKKDSEVTLLENAGLWGYINSGDIKGWIRIDNLISKEVKEEKKEQPKQEEPQKEEPKQEEAYTPKTMYVKPSGVNVRSESNTSSNIVDAIEMNTQVKVVGEENGWYKVEVNGVKGYIRQDLLSTKKSEVTSRNNELDRAAAAQTQQTAATQVTVEQSAQATQTVSQTTTSSSGVTGTDIVNYAMQYKGCRYAYGTAGPNTFDCSGFTSYVYGHFGYKLSRSSRDQANNGKKVTGELQPGDILIFSNNGKTVGHVGIYIGNDKFIHASDSSTGVIVSNLSDKCNKNKYWGARRIL
ncbi:MAG: C40 family peptidase [Clostridia bacterium]|nr:C40 family peptidase [Clostridia bacterium]